MFSDYEAFFAPGRVNLIGEHIDYNGGYVFPCALTIGTYVFVKKRDDDKLRFFSLNKTRFGVKESNLKNMEKGIKTESFADYPLGVMYTLTKNNYPVTSGLDLVFYGNLPSGAGLSSSASMEVVTAYMVKEMFGYDLDFVEMAKLCQWSENNFNGVNCGIMDQFASAMGKNKNAIYLNTNTLDYSYVPVPMDGISLVIANSNNPHKLSDSSYNTRREECSKALLQLKKVLDIKNLCDITPDEFEKYKDVIEDEVVRKRAKHAIYENARTKEAVKVLKEGDLERFGELLKEAHMSMKDDYEATGKTLDTLFFEAIDFDGCIGSRMTGGGFGGCTVSFVKKERVREFKKKVGTAYERKMGIRAVFYEMEIGDGPSKKDSKVIYDLIKSPKFLDIVKGEMKKYF